MSSITYIKQTEPFEIYGAALRVKPKFHDEIKNLFEALTQESERKTRYFQLITREIEMYEWIVYTEEKGSGLAFCLPCC